MHHTANQPRPFDDARRAQRAVVLQLLRDDRNAHWNIAELEQVIVDVRPLDLSEAVAILEVEGVLERRGEVVWASQCALHLDRLEMVAV